MSSRPRHDVPPAAHRNIPDLAFVPFGEGVETQLLQVDLNAGLWIIRQRMRPGVTLPTHNHTGAVYAYTTAGSWKYLEYPDLNTSGSYLFEPAGSVHTLHVPASNTEITDIWFAIHGANLNLDADGGVYEVLDARRVLRIYMSRCFKMGLAPPPVIGAEAEVAAYWAGKATQVSLPA